MFQILYSDGRNFLDSDEYYIIDIDLPLFDDEELVEILENKEKAVKTVDILNGYYKGGR